MWFAARIVSGEKVMTKLEVNFDGFQFSDVSADRLLGTLESEPVDGHRRLTISDSMVIAQKRLLQTLLA